MDGMVKETQTVRILKVRFTEKEKVDLAEQIGNALRNIHAYEDDLKSVTAQYKSDIRKLEAEITGAAEKINTGWEMRNIACMERRDYSTGNVEIYRADTGEIIEERAMTYDERQMGLFEEKAIPEVPTSGNATPGVEDAEATPEPPVIIRTVAPLTVAKGIEAPEDDLPEDSNPFYVGGPNGKDRPIQND